MQLSYDPDQDEPVAFDFIANSMVSEASNLPENVSNLQASGVDTQGEWGAAPENGIEVPDGAKFTGFYKNFQHISYYYNRSIFDGRKRLNVPRKSRSKHRNSSAANSEGNEKTRNQIHR